MEDYEQATTNIIVFASPGIKRQGITCTVQHDHPVTIINVSK